MDNIDKCPECGAPTERWHANMLYDVGRPTIVYHRCTQCDWDDLPYDLTKRERTDNPDGTFEPEDVEPDTIPDTGEEDDIREYNQQLQAMYARGYREGRLAGKIEALSEYATMLGKINERKQKAKRP